MRVLVVTIVHNPDDARIRYRQIRALLEAGHGVTYVAPFEAWQVTPPVEVTAVSVPRAMGRRRMAAVRAARRAIRAYGPAADLVLLHDPELLLATVGLKGLPPVVWDVHEDTAAAVSLKPWLPRPFRKAAAAAVGRLERWAERRHHLLLAEESYQARFTRPHPVVPNTTYVPDRVSPPGADRVVYVGHLTRPRGALDMIELGWLLDGSVTVELIGSAEGETRRALEAASRTGTVTWRGPMPNTAAMEVVRGSLAGLSLLHDEPNYRHSQPTKVIEYMAHGVPVITTPNPAARQLVERHECGIVVPYEDSKAVADAVNRLRRDPALRAAMGRRGHEAALREYSWQADGKAFVAQLEEWAKSTA